MSPLIFEKDGNFHMAVGASGGPLIMTAVLQAVLRSAGLKLDALESVAKPRLHHQLNPPLVLVEDWIEGQAVFNVSQEVRTFLRNKVRMCLHR